MYTFFLTHPVLYLLSYQWGSFARFPIIYPSFKHISIVQLAIPFTLYVAYLATDVLGLSCSVCDVCASHGQVASVVFPLIFGQNHQLFRSFFDLSFQSLQ